ncbi:MAG: DUF2190 family protein [Parcubacteria group bacterium]|jgi:predicted RecA/RadA family phage recombinase
MAVGARARNFRVIDDWGHHVKFVNGSTALEEGDIVYVSSNVLVEGADSCTSGVLGVVASDADASEIVTVLTAGIFEADAATSTNFGFGDKVYLASASTLDAGTSGDKPVGYVTEADPADGGWVQFVLWSVAEGDIDARS